MKNGYTKSLFATEDGVCYLCDYTGQTARHEIFGASNRRLSKQFGLWIAVCPRCHRAIHEDSNSGRFLTLKEDAQYRFMQEYNRDAKEFCKLFGRMYL